jgi:hypothetical protein
MKRTALLVAIGLTVLGVGTVGTAGVASAAKPKAPTVNSITPEHGPLDGGTLVQIRGKNFGGVSAVDFGTTPATSFTPVNQSEVDAYSPAGSGTVDITVTTGIGTSVPVTADQFTYVATPSIQRVAPRAGSTLGGNRVTITGAGFTGTTSVDFGSVAGIDPVVQSDSEILVTTPAESAGSVDVSVTSATGTTPTDPADVYTFALRVPVVTSVASDVGPESGGTPVTISGKVFTHVSAVDFGPNPATDVAVGKHGTITCLSPAGTGTVDVTVTNASGTSAVNSPADEFTYTPSD